MRKVGRYLAHHHLGLIAIFIALGGSAYAASQLPANSVGTRQIRKNAVTLSKIGPRARASLGGGGELQNVYVASSITWRLVPQPISVHVPQGGYLADGRCYGHLDGNANAQGVEFGFVRATLTSSEPQASPNHTFYTSASSVPDTGFPAQAFHYSVVPPYGEAPVSVRGPVRLSNAGVITLTCGSSGPPHPVENVGDLVVIPVKTIHQEF